VHTTYQSRIDGADQLIDRHQFISVPIQDYAAANRGFFESDGNAENQLVNAHLAIAIAISRVHRCRLRYLDEVGW
jgi:hypothetical protein